MALTGGLTVIFGGWRGAGNRWFDHYREDWAGFGPLCVAVLRNNWRALPPIVGDSTPKIGRFAGLCCAGSRVVRG